MKTFATLALTTAAMLCCAAAHAQAAAAAPAAGSRLDDVIARGTLRVCTTGDYKPYSYYRTDGRFEGIDIDMAESLAKSLGVKADFVKTSWPNLTSDFIAKCDIAVGGVSTTLERQKRAFFTQPYVIDGKTPIARCADVDKYQTVAQIDRPETHVIANPGGTNERFAKQFFPHANLTVYPDNVTIFKQILAGKADVMVTDASETLLQQKLNPGLCSVHPDKPFQFGEKAYMVPRGDVVFQQYVDQWLHLALSTGEYRAISDKWLK
ncbi:ArtI protein [Burkholderia sp. Bp9017]|uniref:Transporter substrate-binding domain-containing protein n=1 Tax=Burkholderia anthina TaxID=179879 RepID=A0A7T6VEZ0_9BURK|nr:MULTISPECIES: transporter substrate-binding domain-containing protein [Burkholderia]MBY4867986.1 transporter substrate-binding domain-containing protein [Burkholderia anthina]QQK02706.1 transporter substrate-binding domain-containing protein [Burkholderia anthina]RQZ24556.1 ArtI protein [Burkholderia sp. Bp9017]RQZ32678.1 ArtI protein [Burkholderia sp. Bp9016]